MQPRQFLKAELIVDGYYLYEAYNTFNSLLESYKYRFTLADFVTSLPAVLLHLLRSDMMLNPVNESLRHKLSAENASLVVASKKMVVPSNIAEDLTRQRTFLPNEFINQAVNVYFKISKCNLKHTRKGCGVEVWKPSGLDVKLALKLCKSTTRKDKADIILFISSSESFGEALDYVRETGMDLVLLNFEEPSYGDDSAVTQRYNLGEIFKKCMELANKSFLNLPSVKNFVCPPAELYTKKCMTSKDDTLTQAEKEGLCEDTLKIYQELAKPQKEKLVSKIMSGTEIKTSPCRQYHYITGRCMQKFEDCNYIHDGRYKGLQMPGYILEVHRKIVNKLKTAKSKEEALNMLNIQLQYNAIK